MGNSYISNGIRKCDKYIQEKCLKYLKVLLFLVDQKRFVMAE